MNERAPVLALSRDVSAMLKGIAILLVLLGHTGVVRMGGAGGVALFLIVSGYGLHCSWESGGPEGYWRKRAQKVWLPYFFVGLLAVLVLRVRGVAAVLCTLTGLDLGLIADPTMWYISYIFFWYLVYYVLARLCAGFPEPKRRVLLPAGLLFACIPCVLLARAGFWHAGSLAKAYVPCFPLGVMMSCLRERTLPRAARTGFWTAALLGCGAYLCLPLLGITDRIYLTALAMAGAAIAVLQLVPAGGVLKTALLKTGEYAYPLYLFEGLFLTHWRNWAETMPAKWMADLAFFAASAAAAVLYWTIYRKLEDRAADRAGKEKRERSEPVEEKMPLFALSREATAMLKGVAILLVMLTHSEYIRLAVGTGGVALFVFLSGYGLNVSCERGGLKDYWRRRVSKVWLPYFFVGLLAVLVLRVRGAAAVLCTLTGLDLGLIADPTMWYISYIFFWYAAYYLAFLLTGGIREPKRRTAFLLAGLFLACAPCVLLGRVGFWHRASGSLAYLLCFPLGVAAGACREYRVTRVGYRGFWTACLLVSAACVGLVLCGRIGRILLSCMAVALLAVSLVQLVPVGGVLRAALLKIGEYSYMLYLFEGLFLLPRKNWLALMPAKWMADLAFFAASAAAAVVYWTVYRAVGKRVRAGRG